MQLQISFIATPKPPNLPKPHNSLPPKNSPMPPNSPEFKHLTPFSVAAKKLSSFKAVVGEEVVAVSQALHRVVATDTKAPFSLPTLDNSAVDGFVVFADGKLTKTIVGEAKMGSEPPTFPNADSAFGVATGSPLPLLPSKMPPQTLPQGTPKWQKGTTPLAVVMEEHCRVSGNTLTLAKPAVAGSNIRLSGEDFKKGEVAITKGTKLRPQELATLAALGFNHIRVKKRLKVAIIAVGDELLTSNKPHLKQSHLNPSEPTQPSQPKAGMLHDANTPALEALLRLGGFEPHPYPSIVKDSETAIAAALTKAAKSCDAILVGGGSSSPHKDLVARVLERMAKYQFKKCAIKPARPFSVATMGKVVVFNIPGNVVATNVIFMLMVKPALDLLSGAKRSFVARHRVAADFSLTKKQGRREWHRGKLLIKGGMLRVAKGTSGAGMLSSLTNADGIIELTENQTQITKGEAVSFIPFACLWM